MTKIETQNRWLDHPYSENTSLEFNKFVLPSSENPLDRFSILSLGELGDAALLDRKETKYLFPEELLPDILPGLESEYHILDIKGRRTFAYLSVYIDTPDRVFYKQHQAGARPRWKIRQRTYLNSGISFLEVKRKDNRNLTQKIRRQIEQPKDQQLLVRGLLEQTRYPGSAADLEPVLKTHYTRITLVHKSRQERITLDYRLSFSDGVCTTSLPDLVVAEVKQNRLNLRSPFLIHIKQFRGQPSNFSKYCLGSLLLDPTLKYNRFKPILIQIQSLKAKEKNYEWTL